MTLLAVDPGTNNGLAVLADDGDLLIVAEFPQIGEGAGKRLALARIGELLVQFRVDRAIVEDVSAMPKQGVTSTFRFGRATGQIEGALMALGVPLHFVRPNVWKKVYGTTGKTGAGMRGLAVQRWPTHSESFALVKHEHRAAAALMGAYWMQNGGRK